MVDILAKFFRAKMFFHVDPKALLANNNSWATIAI